MCYISEAQVKSIQPFPSSYGVLASAFYVLEFVVIICIVFLFSTIRLFNLRYINLSVTTIISFTPVFSFNILVHDVHLALGSSESRTLFFFLFLN